MMDMRTQAKRYGADIIHADATKIDFPCRLLKVCAGDEEYQALSIIVATGSSPRWLGLESKQRLIGRGVQLRSMRCPAL